MGRRPSPTGTPVESTGGWRDASSVKSDVLSVAALLIQRSLAVRESAIQLDGNERWLARAP